ncbi:MAG: CAP domain-containing protein [Mycobacteriales bacterium]|nr:CAP domain-containing protein [Mycobacteriales bacterium]
MRLAQRASVLTLTALVAVPLLGSAPALAADGPVFKVHALAPVTATTTSVATAPTTTVVRAQAVTSLSAADVYENRLFQLTNAARTSRGLRPLVKSGCATTIAGNYALRLAQLGKLVHNNMSRVAATCGASGAGENIAFGNVSADQMFQMWMNSSGHRANILRPDYKSMGMGAYKTMSGRWYGVQNFLRA